LQNFRRRNIVPEELAKLGADAVGFLFIRLANFKHHYLVLVITDERFKFALITTQSIEEHLYSSMAVRDIAWLDYDRIHEDAVVRNPDEEKQIPDPTSPRSAEAKTRPNGGFNLDTQGLRLLYNYCRCVFVTCGFLSHNRN
jgi:mediator of RNA polymerase II transcription subunit 14